MRSKNPNETEVTCTNIQTNIFIVFYDEHYNKEMLMHLKMAHGDVDRAVRDSLLIVRRTVFMSLKKIIK